MCAVKVRISSISIRSTETLSLDRRKQEKVLSLVGNERREPNMTLSLFLINTIDGWNEEGLIFLIWFKVLVVLELVLYLRHGKRSGTIK